MQFIEQARSWLTSLGEGAPFALVTLSALLLCHVWRSVHLRSWDRVAALFPKPDTGGLKLALHRVVQGWPALVFGAVVGGISGGEDVKTALKSAAAGALASLLVILRQYGAEWLKSFKGPGGPGPSALAMVVCLSCSQVPAASPDEALAISQAACRAYVALPAELRNERDDKACQVVMRICLVPAEPPAELHAEPPALGNKIVEPTQ
jgi:hypothetical protein